MPIPKLYSVLPLNGDSPDPSLLTNHSSSIVDGSVGEKYAVLSYFPEELKFSFLNDFVVNKYVLFVLEGEEYADYRAEWNCKLIQDGEQVQLKATQVQSPHNFEFTVAISPETFPYQEDWELTLKTTCNLFKDDTLEHTFELEHQLKPIEADLLSGNGASFEDETGDFDATNSSVFLGHEATSHFVRGHLSEYLIEKKSNEITASGNELNNAGTFVHQAAAIAYIKSLTAITDFGVVLEEPSDEFTSQNLSYDLDGPFNKLLSHNNLEAAIVTDGELDIDMIRNIGVFDLHLHHALPLTRGESNVRVDTLDKLLSTIKGIYITNRDEFIRAYHKCVFPKSAVELSVGVFDSLLTAFQAEEVDDLIYHTFEESLEDKKAKITDWKELEYSELRDKGNDDFMKNLISEYYLGYFDRIDDFMIRQINPKQILRIDWSQFIQKILSPSSISVPFTLIKIQVNDLRSGKPLRHALISKLEFFSSDPEIDDSLLPLFLPSEFRYSYEVKAPFDAGIPFEISDSKIKRVQKICRAMGYYKEAIDGIYDNATRVAMHAYLTSKDRELPSPMDLPESASEAHMNAKKDAWIDFIIQDFEANCLTDADGVLNCQIPDQLLENRKLTINVGFSEFAIIREALAGEESSSMSDKPLIRPESDDGDLATRFVAQWDGDPHALLVNPNEQNTNWEDNIADKNFGWKIINAEETREDYLRVALPLEVKRTTTEDINKLKISFGFITDYHSEYTTDDISHFSPFLEDTGVHFVVYGMLWCQPLWAPLSESTTHRVKGGINPAFRIDFSSPGNIADHPNDGEPQGLTSEVVTTFDKYRPYLVTRYRAGSTSQYSRGRDYGTLVINGNNPVGNNRLLNADEDKTTTILTGHYNAGTTPRTRSVGGVAANKTHYGIDYYAVSGQSAVFAITSGKIRRSSDASPGLFGNRINHIVGDYVFTYAHLDSRTVSTDSIVMSGQKIGVAGRTSHERYPGYAPTHLHLEMAGDRNNFYSRLSNPKSIVKKQTVHGEHTENENLYLNNASHRLFPCDCSGGTEVAATQNCHIKSDAGVGAIPNVCWASRNLHCPYMRPSNWGLLAAERQDQLNIFRIQSQLTYLFEDDANDGIPAADQYLNPGDIDGDWGNSCENAIQRFRELHLATIIPNPADRPPVIDVWWLSQPVEGDDTWNALNTEAPYPRTNLNRVDK